jgi:hypothetical protein
MPTPDAILLGSCEAHDECPLCQTGTVEIVNQHVICRGECGNSAPMVNLNDNCLSGYRCPKCGSPGPFNVPVIIRGTVHYGDDGFDYSKVSGESDFDWESGCTWRCLDCDHEADHTKFRLPDVDAKPGPLQPPATPECDKLLELTDKSQPCGEFLTWLKREKGVELGMRSEDSPCCRQGYLQPSHHRIDKLLAEFFNIDLALVEREKRALLAHQRDLNNDHKD